MDSFLTELVHRNRDLLQSAKTSDAKSEDAKRADAKTAGNEALIRESLTGLALARASLARLQLAKEKKQYPLQVVVAGPTQVGKSTLVNLLCTQMLAESSAQAGFTVHCQGFHVVDQISGLYADDQHSDNQHWAARYFGELEHADQQALDRQILQEYSLQETSIAGSKFQNNVIWDTPDFDSIRSFDYRAPLIKAVALADLLVFVVSREKYADKTVWMMFELLAELGIPHLVVMNKTPSSVRPELKTSFENKYRKALPSSELPALLFLDEYKGDLPGAVSQAEVNEVQQAVLAKLDRQQTKTLKHNTLAFLSLHWDDWTASVSAEHRLHREYKDLVERICTDTAQRYRTEYIDSDRHREVMQLALSELLVLLEVPGMAKPLGKIRSVVTWPVRTLMSSSKAPSPVPDDDRNEERRLLDELGKHVVASLSASISIRETGIDERWWQELRSGLADNQDEITQKYTGALDNYQTLLHVEVDRAAQSLYQNLQEQPATLNGLRAARVTADAAAVVLAVKSGGLGAVDLVVAPAMLSLTTLLTESALGKYMDRIQKKLTAYQEKEVQSVIDRKLRKPLLEIVEPRRDKFISEERLQTMKSRLESGDV